MYRIRRETSCVLLTAAKIVFGLLCLAILASHTVTMSRWSEARGVHDDVCYLRQAHLFQRFGLNGFNTDATRDDDHYFVGKLKEIALPEPENVKRWPCHVESRAGRPFCNILLALAFC